MLNKMDAAIAHSRNILMGIKYLFTYSIFSSEDEELIPRFKCPTLTAVILKYIFLSDLAGIVILGRGDNSLCFCITSGVPEVSYVKYSVASLSSGLLQIWIQPSTVHLNYMKTKTHNFVLFIFIYLNMYMSLWCHAYKTVVASYTLLNLNINGNSLDTQKTLGLFELTPKY